MNKKTIVFTIILIIVSSVGLFFSGYYIKSLLSEEISIKESTQKPPVVFDENESSLFLPGKHYFDDTILLISKEEPHHTLVATVNRTEKDDLNYLQNTRISFFDGNNWKRVIRSDINPNSRIENNNFISNWTTDFDESRVLRQKVTGQINVDETTIKFSTEVLENEIGIRSLPGYTKFMSEGQGIININGVSFECYVLYTRIYSSNSSELFTYDGNIGLLTDWVAFWDNESNFYHVDSTEVKDPIPNYQTHSIGVFKNSLGGIYKTFNISVERDTSNPPQSYVINFGIPINKKLKFNKLNDINKSPSNMYSWHMGMVKNDSGIGIVEYILK